MILYHIRLHSEEETFEKIGITKYDTFKRFGKQFYLEYNITVLNILDFVTKEECYKFEQYLHRKFKYIQYVPLNEKFSGKTECFLPFEISLDDYKNGHNKYAEIVLEHNYNAGL